MVPYLHCALSRTEAAGLQVCAEAVAICLFVVVLAIVVVITL